MDVGTGRRSNLMTLKSLMKFLFVLGEARVYDSRVLNVPNLLEHLHTNCKCIKCRYFIVQLAREKHSKRQSQNFLIKPDSR